MRIPRSLLTGVLVALPFVSQAQHVVGTRDARALRADSVFQRFDRTDSPGCAMGVYQDGKLLYARGYGMASLAHGAPLSPRSVLDIGSVSKQFTAMAMLLLEKDGRLSLDDPIRKYFPEMPAYADRVTLRRALSQTSGLRDLYVMMDQTGRAFDGDTIDALRIITRSAEPNYEPGARYLYTNSGWILAAQIVYRLTGKTLAQFAEERIFAPLGMRDTRYLSDASMNIPNLADSYTPQAGGGYRRVLSTYDGSIMGAGAVQTTIEDFGRWLDNYDAGTVGGAEIISMMTKPTMLNDGKPAITGAGTGLAYALGLSVGTVRGLPTISHGGSWAGYRAHFLRFPIQRTSVATFCNLSTSGPDSLARKVAAIYLGDRLQPDTAAQWIATLAGTSRGEVTRDDLRSLTGVWRNIERGEVRRTRLSGDTLVMTGGARLALTPLGGNRFRGTGAEVRFDGDGAASRLVVRTATDVAVYSREDSATLSPKELAEFAGSYRNEEVESTHVWKLEKAQLVLYVNDRRQGVLEPTYWNGFLRGSTVIDVERDGRGRITGFNLQAGRVRNLRFTRVR
jgi:CubicO group peptidase (beta-lactamase class C family)